MPSSKPSRLVDDLELEKLLDQDGRVRFELRAGEEYRLALSSQVEAWKHLHAKCYRPIDSGRTHLEIVWELGTLRGFFRPELESDERLEWVSLILENSGWETSVRVSIDDEGRITPIRLPAGNYVPRIKVAGPRVGWGDSSRLLPDREIVVPPGGEVVLDG